MTGAATGVATTATTGLVQATVIVCTVLSTTSGVAVVDRTLLVPTGLVQAMVIV